jgi:hypothetical protein
VPTAANRRPIAISLAQPAHTTCDGESSEEKLLAKINTLESRAMTTNMTIDERYYRAGQLEQFISDQRAEFEDRDLPPDDVHQSLKNAEEELARHTAVIHQRKAWDRQMIEGVRSGRYQVESGDGRTVDLGRNSDHSHDHVPQWLPRQRDEALRTVDRYTRSDHLDAPAAGRLDALVRASGTKIDPAGIGARYLAAVGLPAYTSAFGKILADPIHGHLRL